jgi:hypothetical protein
LSFNPSLIKRTAVCYWSQPDDCYIARSPLFDLGMGMGDSREESLDSLEASLEAFTEDFKTHPYTEGAGHFELHANARQRTITVLEQLSKKFQCSMDDALDYVIGYLLMAGLPEKPNGQLRKPLDDVIAS